MTMPPSPCGFQRSLLISFTITSTPKGSLSLVLLCCGRRLIQRRGHNAIFQHLDPTLICVAV